MLRVGELRHLCGRSCSRDRPFSIIGTCLWLACFGHVREPIVLCTYSHIYCYVALAHSPSILRALNAIVFVTCQCTKPESTTYPSRERTPLCCPIAYVQASVPRIVLGGSHVRVHRAVVAALVTRHRDATRQQDKGLYTKRSGLACVDDRTRAG